MDVDRQRVKAQNIRKWTAFFMLFSVFFLLTDGMLLKAAEPTLTVSKKTIYIGTDYQINCKNLAATAKLSYKSSDKKVATVNAKGVVTPVAKGTATITVTIKQSGKTYTRTIALTVKKPYISISNKAKTLVQSSDYLLVGKAYGIKDAKFSFSSSDILVAKVDKSTGMLHARGEGEAKITMKDATSGLSVSFTVTVTALTEENAKEVYVSTESFSKKYTYKKPSKTSDMTKEEIAFADRLVEIQKKVTAGKSITVQEMEDYYLGKSMQGGGK